jgi:hypothetical protein
LPDSPTPYPKCRVNDTRCRGSSTPAEDYSNFIATDSQNITQVTDAPETYSLWAFDAPLQSPTQFDLWLQNCYEPLDQKGLARFID